MVIGKIVIEYFPLSGSGDILRLIRSMRLGPLCCDTHPQLGGLRQSWSNNVKRAASLARPEGTDVCDRSRRTVLSNWPGATLAWAAELGLDPLSLRPTGALAKNGVVDLGTGRLRAYSWPVMAITFGRQTLEHMVCFN
jgi:hypothetical protein